MTDLAKIISARLRATNQAQTLQDEKFVEQQRLKRANGNGVWQEVREAVIAHCDAVNREMGAKVAIVEPTASSQLRIRALLNASSVRILRAEYFTEQLQMHWECEDRHGHWHLATMGNGRVTFVRGQMDEPVKSQEIADHLFKILFNAE